tara:strand:- start:958 stop:1347 length:390 start_codon:yes stop_codon:yes gene_type:complete
MALGLIVLTITGIIPFLSGQQPISNWLLFVHVGAAPLFISGLTISSVILAEHHRIRCDRGNCTTGAAFWMLIAFSFVAVLAILLCMLPTFSSESQERLYSIHKWAGLIAAVMAVLYGVRIVGGEASSKR